MYRHAMAGAAALFFCLAATTSTADQAGQVSLSTYGTPGLVEMPVARVLQPGELAFTASQFGPSWRYTATFQVLPWIYGSFRYSVIDFPGGNLFDRSFDVHFQLADETATRPGIALGLRDFLGTGVYSGEYVVATKSLGSRVSVSGGIGWGRLAGRGSFTNPLGVLDDRFEDRPGGYNANGGQLETGNWFRGPTSFFGGVEYRLSDSTRLFAEYSPDTYDRESRVPDFENTSPLNLGISHRFDNGVSVKGFYIGGHEIGAQLSYAINPGQRPIPGGAEPAPRTVGDRDRLTAAEWNNSLSGGGTAALEPVLKARLAEEGLALHGVSVAADAATVHIANNRWDVEAQAAGRAARVLAETLPPQIETFAIIFVQKGVPITKVTTRRSDLEELQFDHDGAWRTLARARIEDAPTAPRPEATPAPFPAFDYALTPYLATSFFDPDDPVRADLGAQLALSYQPAPGLTFGGRFRYPLIGNIDKATRQSNSVIQRVRTDSVRYAKESDLEINSLTAEYIFRPGADLFGRVTGGYLEDMYGGLSAELLWYPVDSRLALGAEINYAKQRDFDMLFGFQDYDVVTGHASAYYDIGHGFYGQIDMGRYLAGDWGATFSLDREFNNGFKIGGYFTLTDVSFDDFGEGSFDKGIRVEIPLSWLTGRPSRETFNHTIQPILRDGGARLMVDNRLHGLVRDYRAQELRDGWGRYLR